MEGREVWGRSGELRSLGFERGRLEVGGGGWRTGVKGEEEIREEVKNGDTRGRRRSLQRFR